MIMLILKINDQKTLRELTDVSINFLNFHACWDIKSGYVIWG